MSSKMTFPGFALAFGALVHTPAQAQNTDVDVPFVTTPDAVVTAMLEAGAVKRRDYLIDLGAGDGRIVITAARRLGTRGLGVEIDPALVELARANARQAGVSHLATFALQDLHQTHLRRASVVTLYLLPEVNLQLRPKLLALKPGTRIVSHDWDMGDWQPDDLREIAVPDKTLGREKFSRVYAWTVPANIGGDWCHRSERGARLSLTQKFQRIDGAAISANGPQPLAGRLQGALVRLSIGLDEWSGAVARGVLTLKNGSTAHRYQRCR